MTCVVPFQALLRVYQNWLIKNNNRSINELNHYWQCSISLETVLEKFGVYIRLPSYYECAYL